VSDIRYGFGMVGESGGMLDTSTNLVAYKIRSPKGAADVTTAGHVLLSAGVVAGRLGWNGIIFAQNIRCNAQYNFRYNIVLI
jgi:hypothetical protein